MRDRRCYRLLSVNGMANEMLEPHFRAQYGEDRILWQVFRGRRSGYFIEIGAFDGVTLSNTFFFEQVGWCGLLIEPIPKMYERAVAARPRSRVVHAALGARGSRGTAKFTFTKKVGVLSFLKTDPEHLERCRREGAELIEVEVPLTTVGDLLMEEQRSPALTGSPWSPEKGWQIDFVSIDVEGMELEVLDGFDLGLFRPRILVIENERATGAALEPYLAARGYGRFYRQVINDFYVRLDDPATDLHLSGFALPAGTAGPGP